MYIEEDNLVVFDYFSAYGIWPHKRDSLWWEWPHKRDSLWWEWPHKRDSLWWEWPHKRDSLWWEWPLGEGDYCAIFAICLF